MTIPSGYKELFEASGAVIKYRLLRDVIGEDDSFHRTAKLQTEIIKSVEAQKLFAEQLDDSSWLDTPRVFMRLCEMGLEKCEAVQECLEKFLIPSLLAASPQPSQRLGPNAKENFVEGQILRDNLLQLILRAKPNPDEIGVLALEQILAEWGRFLKADYTKRKQLIPPSFASYAAVCYAKWPPQKLARVQDLVRQLFVYGETVQPAENIFYLREKADYILQPQRMLYELELTARIGLTRELAASRWMFEELEFHQDGDGQFRFDPSLLPEEFGESQAAIEAKSDELNWYFPLENSAEHWTDFSFRAHHIFKLLEFDF